MKEHFEPYTRTPDNYPRCLIVNGHSSHLTCKVVQYALDHDIHIICLPSKSTHVLQALDVGCFGTLQTTYERNLNAWLRRNPLSVITKPSFLQILSKTRMEVYTIECITGVWHKFGCWPITRSFTPEDTSSNVSDNVLDSILALDTPSRLRTQSCRIKGFIHTIPEDAKEEIYGLLDFAIEKVTRYRDILPQAETLTKLRTGKIRREKVRSRYIQGETRVLSHKHVNEGLKNLKILRKKELNVNGILNAGSR